MRGGGTLCNHDTNGTLKSGKVSLFQGFNCMQELFFGRKMCPNFRVSSFQGVHICFPPESKKKTPVHKMCLKVTVTTDDLPWLPKLQVYDVKSSNQ